MLDLGVSGSVTGTTRQTRDKRSGGVPKLPAIRDATSSEINLSGRRSGTSNRGVMSSVVSKGAAGVDVMELKMAKLQSQSTEVTGSTVRSNVRHAAGKDTNEIVLCEASFGENAVEVGMSIGYSGGSGVAMFNTEEVNINRRQSEIVFDSNAFNGTESNHAPVPDRKPKGMQRAKHWTCDVENMFRYQLAGWRDMYEYVSVHAPPAVWEDVGFVRCLQNKVGNFMYFRKSRECDDKHLAKVKLYTY